MRNRISLPFYLALGLLAACGPQDSGVGSDQNEQADPFGQNEQADPFGQQQTPQEGQQPAQQPNPQPDQGGGLQNPPQGQ